MSLPLKGIRILDFARMLPGPYCTMILADLGAEVIRIEDPNFFMGNPPPFHKNSSVSAFNAILNRNKKSIGLNLKKSKEEALGVVHKLVETADVIVEGFRPGITKKLGIDYESLSKINPSLIYCSITGYGQTGPKNTDAGHDMNYLSLSGILDLNRDQSDENSKPVVPCIQPADIGGALYGAIGILAALKKRDGDPKKRGESIDIAMADCVLSMNPMATAFEFTGNKKEDNILHGDPPYYSVYKTKDGNFMAVGSIEAKFFTNLCNALELPQYIPKQFATGEEKQKMKDVFTHAFLSKDQDEWVKVFEKYEACVTPIQTIKDAIKEPHFIQRGIIRTEQHPTAGIIQNIGSPIKFSSTELPISTSAPSIGEHTKEVLQSVGYSEEEIKALKKKRLFR